MHSSPERILSAAHPLSLEHGYRAVSEETILDAAGVSEQELSSELPSKEALAVASVVHRDRAWTIAATEASARVRGTDPGSRLLALFDLLEESFQSDEEDAAPFLEVLIDLERDNRLGQPDTDHLAHVREAIERLAREANLHEPEAFALSFHVLLKGGILSALEGDTLAGVRAREMGRELMSRHLPARDLPGEAAAVPGSTWFGDPSFDLYEVAGLREVPASSLIDWFDDDEFEDRVAV